MSDEILKPKLPKLTRKQRAFVNELKKNPKQSATKAVQKTYDVSNYNTARAIASENLAKPAIISHLNNYNELIESTITNAITEYSTSSDIKERTLAVDTSKWVHDKLHGKAIQRTENTNLNINIQDALDLLR
jgi:phage terminase small subunit